MNHRIRLFLFAALSLVALLLPAVALAADGAPEVASGALQLAGVVSLLLAGAGIVVRLVKVTSPLHGWLPARWRWIPDAVLGAAGTLLSGLPMATGTVDVVMVCVSAAVLVAVAAGAGFKAPDATPKPTETIHVVIPPTGIVFLVLLLASAGCSPSLGRAQELGAARRAVGAAPDEAGGDRCDHRSNVEKALRYFAVGSAALGGGAGLTTISTDDREADRALALTAAGFAAAAIATESIRAEVASDWAAECSQ